MAKITPEKLAALQQHDKPAFDFNNPEISAFSSAPCPTVTPSRRMASRRIPDFFKRPIDATLMAAPMS